MSRQEGEPVDGLIWAQQRAQDAFRRGREAADPQAARRWLERARRLSSGAVHVDVALALARVRAGDAAGAIPLLRALLRRFDFREGWTALAGAYHACGQGEEAAKALQRALSHHAPEPGLETFTTRIARGAAWPGWCGLSGAGRLVIDGAPFAGRAPGTEIRIDGERLEGGMLPPAWRQARQIVLRRGSAALLGSPIDIRSVLRSEGFVEAVEGGLQGWLWHPGEPERAPCLAVLGADGSRRELRLDAFAEDVDSETPLARPRRLFLPRADLPAGPVRLLAAADGGPLTGSPVVLARQRGSPRGKRAQRPILPADHRGGPAASHAPNPGCDIVIPAYRDLARTLDCIESVRGTVPAASRIVVIDDASPEPDLSAALDQLAEAGAILLHRHAENQGFPAAANRGFVLCAGRDVVLLNSDTLLAPGWLEALREAVYGASDIGTATPFSNDASILSYPSVKRVNAVPDRAETRRLMALARRAARGRAGAIEIPTGNGFCLYVRRDCLDATGPLREDLFAQGYGEENDFCLRARHLGWRHVGVPGAYVGHVGQVSFGAARPALMRRNLAILNRLHPGYDALIAAHIKADPFAEARRRIDRLRFIGLRSPAPRAVLLFTHAEAGGVERVVQSRARMLAGQGIRPIILRPHEGACLVDGPGEPGIPEFPNLLYRLPEEFEQLAALLAGEGLLHAEWHHWRGHHPALRGLCARLQLPYDIHVHDYALFCARITLIGPERHYCGEPDLAGCEACVARQGSQLGEAIGPAALVARSARELAAARAVIVPSEDTAKRVARHFPGIAPRIEALADDAFDLLLARRAEAGPMPPPSLPEAAGRTRICVVGGIGVEKGHAVLLACLRDAAARALPLDFVLVGHSADDDAIFEAGCLEVTGPYRDDAEAVALLRAARCDIALLPSIWPETWCFTLGLVWSAGLAAAVFDIGAQAERVRRSKRGAVLPLGLPAGLLNDALLRLCRRQQISTGASPQTVSAPLRIMS